MTEVTAKTNALLGLNTSRLEDSVKKIGNSSFWYYTRLDLADSVLCNRSFWVGRISEMNDLDELKLHEDEKLSIFALCFCNSNSEKIPMWYLYFGIFGTGAALGLSPQKMVQFIREIKTVKAVPEDGEPVLLEIGRDVELRFGWVFYQKQQKKYQNQIYYRGKWYHVDDIESFISGNYFLKAYPWEYEREFRLVFITKPGTRYKRLEIIMTEEIRNSIMIRLAPELKKESFCPIPKLKYIGTPHTQKPRFSTLKIQMNLFKRNRKDLPTYLQEDFKKAEPDNDPKELCALIESAGLCARRKKTRTRSK